MKRYNPVVARCQWRERAYGHVDKDWLSRWLDECERCRVRNCPDRLHRVDFPPFKGDSVLDRSGKLWELVNGDKWVCRGRRS